MSTTRTPPKTRAPKVGIVSLGCPKALVDSERILTRLRAEGYALSATYEGADVVVVNTCGFLDSAKQESLDAIGEAMAANGRVIVTGCLGIDEGAIRTFHPDVLAVTGPHQYEQVVGAIHDAVAPPHDPFQDLVPPGGLKLTPRHYAYLKISEGCNHHCTFCIIPSIRGRLVSRPLDDVVREAEALVSAGVKELLVVSQDTGAYGIDLDKRQHLTELAARLGELGAWVRLHYVYPYPHVDEVIPLMAAGRVLPYLDIPFQHAHPRVLKAMRRPADHEKLLERIQGWRRDCPDLTIRSTFIAGFPGETEEEFEFLLDWLAEAKLDRVGCFKYEAVDGAVANGLGELLDEDEKQDRWERLMELQARISEERMAAKVGRTLDVLIDAVDAEGAIGRSAADAPEIDGQVFLDGATALKPGDIVPVVIEEAEDYDLWGRLAG